MNWRQLINQLNIVRGNQFSQLIIRSPFCVIVETNLMADYCAFRFMLDKLTVYSFVVSSESLHNALCSNQIIPTYVWIIKWHDDSCSTS